MNIDNRAGIATCVVTGIGLLALLLWGIFIHNETHSELSYDRVAENLFLVSNNDSKFTYEVAKSTVTFKGVVTMTGFNAGVKDGGVIMTLHSLSHKSVQKFDQRYGKTGQCPAPFFNRYAKRKLLLASNKAVEKKILSIDLPDYRKSETWKDYIIKGRCAKRLTSGSDSEGPLFLDEWNFRGCRMIVVDDLIVTPRRSN